jgi:molecular chaperone HtpG
MYKEKGIEILFAPSHLDTPLMTFLEGKHSGTTFQRLDGAVDDVILDKEREKSVLDADGKTEAVKIADFFRSKLSDETLEVEAKSLSSNSVPAFMMLSERERRMRDYFALSGQDLPASMGSKRTFVVNTNSPLVQSIQKLEKKDQELATSLVKQLFELSLLSQRELGPEDFSTFLKRSTDVLEKLTNAATK